MLNISWERTQKEVRRRGKPELERFAPPCLTKVGDLYGLQFLSLYHTMKEEALSDYIWKKSSTRPRWETSLSDVSSV